MSGSANESGSSVCGVLDFKEASSLRKKASVEGRAMFSVRDTIKVGRKLSAVSREGV